jgi:predicted metal-dependent enzyme (double-stranded beta helix superfamily)
MTTTDKHGSGGRVADLPPLQRFVTALAAVVDRPEAAVLAAGRPLLAGLVADDGWLDARWRQPDPDRYRQYLLHRDPAGRFSVVSFVWGPGQSTPVHDHGTWGLIGMLVGAETATSYRCGPDGLVAVGPATVLAPGEVDAVSPTIGDIHAVANALGDRPSVSIHVYGGDIGAIRRHTYQPDGTARPFVSGYTNAVPDDPADGPFAWS